VKRERGTFNLLSREVLARRRARLLARIHRKFKTVTDDLHITPLRLAFTRVADPDVVLDEIVRKEDRREKLTGQRHEGNDLHLPYWAELWDSSFGLAQFLVLANDEVTRWKGDKVKDHPVSILDLGCGMGLAGTVAAAMGGNVLLADLEPDALLFAKLNALPYSGRVEVRRLNWQTDRLAEKFEMILGADVLYERAQWEFLDAFWKAHLIDRGNVVLAEPGRQSGDQFIDWIASRGWLLERREQAVQSRGKTIRIFKLSLAQ